MSLMKCSFLHENVATGPQTSSACFMLLKTVFSHGFILTKFRRCDAKPDFIYMYVFTDIMLAPYFGLQVKIDWILNRSWEFQGGK